MHNRKSSGSIIIQVAALFLAGILITGMMTFFTEQSLNSQYVLRQTEQDAAEVAAILKGNDCNGRGTSCADQLAQAIELALEEEKKKA